MPPTDQILQICSDKALSCYDSFINEEIGNSSDDILLMFLLMTVIIRQHPSERAPAMVTR